MIKNDEGIPSWRSTLFAGTAPPPIQSSSTIVQSALDPGCWLSLASTPSPPHPASLYIDLDTVELLSRLLERVNALQDGMSLLIKQMAEEASSSDPVSDHVDAILTDLARNRVPAKQIDRLDTAVERAKRDRAVADQMRRS